MRYSIYYSGSSSSSSCCCRRCCCCCCRRRRRSVVVDVVVYIFEFCREIRFATSSNKSVVNILLHMCSKYPVKGRVNLPLYRIWRRIWECRYTALILDLSAVWIWVVSFTPRPLHPRKGTPGTTEQETSRVPEPLWTGLFWFCRGSIPASTISCPSFK